MSHFLTNEAIYVDRDGNRVGRNDPSVASMFVSSNKRITLEDARRFNLIADEPEPAGALEAEAAAEVERVAAEHEAAEAAAIAEVERVAAEHEAAEAAAIAEHAATTAALTAPVAESATPAVKAAVAPQDKARHGQSNKGRGR